jgi:hypothetical protein
LRHSYEILQIRYCTLEIFPSLETEAELKQCLDYPDSITVKSHPYRQVPLYAILDKAGRYKCGGALWRLNTKLATIVKTRPNTKQKHLSIEQSSVNRLPDNAGVLSCSNDGVWGQRTKRHTEEQSW